MSFNVQGAKGLTIPEGTVKTIHDKDNRLLWGAVGYNTKYAGDTYQQTYSGKNLLPPPADFTENVNGLAISCSGGEWTFSGTPTSGSMQVKTVIAPYTIQSGDYFHYNNTLVSTRINIALNFTDNTTFAASMNAANRIVSLADHVGKTIATVRANFNNGYEFNGTASPMILHNVSTATTYEPYVGGIPSPNPDYPQDIQVVTGEQTIKVTGKNLFDRANAEENKALKWNEGDYFAETGSLAFGDFLPVAEGDIFSTNYYAQVLFYDANKNYLGALIGTSSQSLVKAPGDVYKSFTVLPGYNIAFMKLGFRPINNRGVNLLSANIQLELGSATDYEPYQEQTFPISLGSIELCGIEKKPDGTYTYQDYIWKDGADWKVHKAVGKVVLNGTENWQVYTMASTGAHVFYWSGLGDFAIENNTPISDHFTGQINVSGGGSVNDGRVAFNKSTTTTRLFARYDALFGPQSTASDFIAWLSTHNTTVYYALATPTDTAITDETLIGQLEAIDEWMTRYGYVGTVFGSLPIVIDRTTI